MCIYYIYIFINKNYVYFHEQILIRPIRFVLMVESYGTWKGILQQAWKLGQELTILSVSVLIKFTISPELNRINIVRKTHTYNIYSKKYSVIYVVKKLVRKDDRLV